MPNLGWVSFKAPQYASFVTIRGISCHNCSQFVVQMDPRPDGMDEQLLLQSYSPFRGPATMFTAPLDPKKHYTLNLTGVHDEGGPDGDVLLLQDVEFVVSENAGTSGLSKGAIAGIVVGSVVGALLLALALFCCCRCCCGGRRRNKEDEHPRGLRRRRDRHADGSVVDLTQPAAAYPTLGHPVARQYTGHAAAGGAPPPMALGHMHGYQAPGPSYRMSPGPGSGRSSPYESAAQSPFATPPAHPDSPEHHPSTDIPRREITDLDDYFQARDSYIDPAWAEEHREADIGDAHAHAYAHAKGVPSPPPPMPPAVTQERDAGRLVAIPPQRAAALPEYRPSSQFIVDHSVGAPEASTGPGRPARRR